MTEDCADAPRSFTSVRPLHERFANCLDDHPPLDALRSTLLAALTHAPDRAREALAEWVAAVDFDRIDGGSYRLIPALFARFGRDPLCASLSGRMGGIYRYHLYRNHLLLEACAKTLRALDDAGIPAMPMKGIALTRLTGGSPARRPMADADVLVTPDDYDAATAIVESLGWRYRHDATRRARDIHARDHLDDRGLGFDLHRFSLVDSPRAEHDARTWARAHAESWRGANVYWMSSEDLALHTVVHGLRDSNRSRFDWMHDMTLIVAATPEFDWQVLWREATARGLTDALFAGLLQLRRHVPDTLPETVLQTLLDGDPDFVRHTAYRLVAETRCDALDAELTARVAAAAPPAPRASWFALLRRPVPPLTRVATDARFIKHIRYRRDEDGHIVAIYLHPAYKGWLGQLFRVADRRTLRTRLAGFAPPEAEWLELGRGVLELPAPTPPGRRKAKLRLAEPCDELHMRPGERRTFGVFVGNRSRFCWTQHAGAEPSFGLSWHLFDARGRKLRHDHHRTPLLPRRHGCVVFIAPGQEVFSSMTLDAPMEPGLYRVDFDLVEEHVTWFSQHGMAVPQFALTVGS